MRIFKFTLAFLLLMPLSHISAQQSALDETGQSLEENVVERTQDQLMSEAEIDSVTARFLAPATSPRWRATDSLGVLPPEPQQDSGGHGKATLALVIILALAIAFLVSTTSISPR